MPKYDTWMFHSQHRKIILVFIPQNNKSSLICDIKFQLKSVYLSTDKRVSIDVPMRTYLIQYTFSDPNSFETREECPSQNIWPKNSY